MHEGITIMNFLEQIKRPAVMAATISLFFLCTIIISGFVAISYRQAEIEETIREIRAEYIPVKDVVLGKQTRIVERMVTTSSIWRPVQDRIKDTVVQIVTHVVDFDFLQPFRTHSQGTSYGSGFFINDQGDIITNAHVVDQATSIWIQIPSLGKRVIDAHIIGVAPERDLAIIRVNDDDQRYIQQELGGIPYLPLGDSDLIRRSDDVLALGYPLGQQSLKSTTGVVSGCEQHFIQISAPINPGSSGGPLLNVQGEVIGINSSGITAAQNIGYAIPINELKLVLSGLYKNRLLRKPFLGFVVNSGTQTLMEYLGNPPPGGCYVVEVLKGSAMERAGVLGGDMMYEINGHTVDLFGEMTVPWSEDKLSVIDYVSRLTPGQNVHVVAYRNGERKEFQVKFDHSELSAIPRVYPGHESIDYEIFGGMVVMQLTKNHIQLLANQAPGLARYAEMRLQCCPTLVVTHIFPNSHLCRCRNLSVGSTISEVNGIQIYTLDEFREALKRGISNKFLTYRTSDHVGRFSDNIFTVLPWDKVLDEEHKLAQCYHYEPTKSTCELIKIYQAQRTLSGTPLKMN